MNKYENDLKQILYTLKYASKSRKQSSEEVWPIDNEDVGKPDYMAYMGIKELVERATPKKIVNQDLLYCPNYLCSCGIDDEHYKYCPYCGQALDWSK